MNKTRYQLYRRQGGIYYCEDTHTGKQVSLGTRDRPAALHLLQAREQSAEQPLLNRAMARTYLEAADPQLTRRTWTEVMDGYNRRRNRASTKERCARAFASPDFNAIRALIATETRADHFLAVLTLGGNATNHYLRRLHNFALGMGYLLCPVLTSKVWPPVRGKKRRAITAAEHQRIVAAEENNPERQAYYELVWATGGGQTDIAHLTDGNVEWQDRILDYARCKLPVDAPHSLMRFGDQTRALLERLPQHGPLFPTIRRTSPNDRAAEFFRRCKLLGIKGVSLHSYRYAWAERAAAAGYPERYAQAALGHASKAVHRAYSRRVKVVAPPLENYEAATVRDKIVDFPVANQCETSLPNTSHAQMNG